MKQAETSRYIIDWIKDYCTESHSSGLTIGVSGGIDSALVSTLCAQTGLPTLLVTLPIHQAASHVSRAEQHVKYLTSLYPNVSHIEIDLSKTFDTMMEFLPRIGVEKKDLLAAANTRSRLRMTALYHVASLHGHLVVGTGNKIEDFGVGFFTKWGDGGVDISPIGDLTKSEVYQLSEYLGVDESILHAAPSDGLFDNDQTDEMQIGATYPELEWAMEMAEKGAVADDFAGREKEVMQIYLHRNRINQHKMRPIPVCSLPRELHE